MAGHNFESNLKINRNQLLNAVLERGTTVAINAALSAIAQIGYDTDLDKIKFAKSTGVKYALDNDNIIGTANFAANITNNVDLPSVKAVYDFYSSTDLSRGASQVGINDAGDYFASLNVEGALAELAISGSGGVFLENIIFVDPNGSDITGDGRIAKPYATLEKARDESYSGDLIYVMPGIYNITSDLAKDGISYYFTKGSIVNCATANDIFFSNAFAIPCNVYGYGVFNKSAAAGHIYKYLFGSAPLEPSVFECEKALSSIDSCLSFVGNGTHTHVTIRGLKIQTTNGTAVYIENVDYARIDVNSLLALGGLGRALHLKSTRGLFNVVLYFGTGYGIYDEAAQDSIFNGSFIDGSTAAMNIIGGGTAYPVIINIAFIHKLIVFNMNVICSGEVQFLECAGNTYGHFAFVSNYFDITDSVVMIDKLINTGNSPITKTIYTTEVIIRKVFFETSASSCIVIDDGKLVVNYALINHTGNYVRFAITGANANVELKEVEIGTATLASRIIWLLDGKLRVGRIDNNIDSPIANCIAMESGELICNGSVLLTKNIEACPIRAQWGPQNIKVYAGGLNTNWITDNILALKVQKDRITIISVVVGCTYKNVINVTNTYQYTAVGGDTIVTIATALAALVAAGEIDLTIVDNLDGTYDINGTAAGDYFVNTVNSTTPSGKISLSNLRLNSYGFTNITGGTILADSDIN